MKTFSGNVLGVKVQPALVVMVAAAALLMISPAAALQEPPKSSYLGKFSLPSRTTTCTRNATICLDPKLSPAGPTCCASRCVNVNTDIYNCGACSRPCQDYWSCCGGQCVNTRNDILNCGSCGHVCPVAKFKKGKRAVARCSYGLCAYNGYD